MRFLHVLFFIFLVLLAVSCSKKDNTRVMEEKDTPAELIKYGDDFFKSGDYESAFIAYGLIHNNYPTSREYIDATIGLSRCYGALKDYDTQFDLLFNLLRENLIPSKVPLVYNAIAEFYEKSAGISEQLTGESSGDLHTAIDYYRKAIEYPNSDDLEAKGFAQFKIGNLFEDMRDYSQAIQAYKNTINQYPNTEWSVRAESQIEKIRLKSTGEISPAPATTNMESQQEKMVQTPDTMKTDSMNTTPPESGKE